MLVAVTLVVWSAWGLLTSSRFAQAAHLVCDPSATAAEMYEQSTCSSAWYVYGFPD
jgi:hypothetical protein